MSDRDLYNSFGRYMVANAVLGGAAAELSKINREEAAKLAEARLFNSHYMTESELADKTGYSLMVYGVDETYEFLWKSLLKEIIHDARNQKEFKSHLSDLIEQRRKKYRPFFEKIERDMPIELAELEPEEICTVLSIGLMTPEELKQYHDDKEAEERADNLMENIGIAFRAILIIGMLILMFSLSA